MIHSYLFWPASAKNNIDVNMCSLPFPHRTANCTAALLIITELQYEWRCPYMAKELQRHGPVELSHAQRSRMTSVSGWPSTKKARTLSLSLNLFVRTLSLSLRLPSAAAYMWCMLASVSYKGLTVSSSGRESHKKRGVGAVGPGYALHCKEPTAQTHCKCYRKECEEWLEPVWETRGSCQLWSDHVRHSDSQCLVLGPVVTLCVRVCVCNHAIFSSGDSGLLIN